MTPFDINPEHDAGHAIDQDDLIAFHLHELSSPQERALHRVLRTDPALQSESLAIASTLRAFPKQEAALPLDAAALDRHWLTLRNSLPLHVPPATIAPHSFFPRWGFPALAASALAATAIILALYHSPHTTTPTVATNQSPSSAKAAPPASNATSASDSTLSTNPSTPFSALPSSSIRHTPFLNHALPQPRPTSAFTSPNPIPTSPSTSEPIQQPITSSPSETSPANTSIATTQQPQSPPAQTPLTPTFTPISETRGHARTYDAHTTDVTLAVIGNLTPDRSFTSLAGTGSSAVTGSFTQETTPSVGALASFHQQLRPWVGYRLTAAYSEPTFEDDYSASGNGKSGNIIDEHVYEASGTYVIQGPHHHRLSTSAEAGAGILAFHHVNQTLSADPVSNVVRPTGIFGVSAELALSKHWAIHTGYRAALYRAPTAYPTYGYTVPPAPNNLTLSSEPVIGLTYRFHEASE